MIIKWRSAAFLAAFLTVSGGPAPLLAASGAAVGELNAAAGSTAQAASAYGEGVSDAFAYISRLGGINGKPIALNVIRSNDLMRDAMLGADRAGSITGHQEDPGAMRDRAGGTRRRVSSNHLPGKLSPRHDRDPFSQRIQRRESACAEGLHDDRAGPPGPPRLAAI
jgi:hypothetical protein